MKTFERKVLRRASRSGEEVEWKVGSTLRAFFIHKFPTLVPMCGYGYGMGWDTWIPFRRGGLVLKLRSGGVPVRRQERQMGSACARRGAIDCKYGFEK